MNTVFVQDQQETEVAHVTSGESRRKKLAYALYLSDQMLNAAREGDWIKVEFLDDERRQLLTDDIFEAEGASGRLVADAISALITVNQEISFLAEQVQHSIQQQHKQQRSLRQASHSYATVAGI
ncbi:MAG: flagellar protein FliT [Gammaproteobacteria bacterium]